MAERSDLIQEILNHFNTLAPGHVYKLSMPDDMPAWLVRLPECYGVAVPWPNDDSFYARFARAVVESTHLLIGEGREEPVLFLQVNDETYHAGAVAQEFASLCADFVTPGEHGENRDLLLRHTDTWWEHWCRLMGNTNSNLPVHSVLAELLFYRWLLHHGHQAENIAWTGGDHTRLDFESGEQAWEVKATLSHMRNEVTIHGASQLNTPDDHPLSLVFCRLEESPQGESINDLAQELPALGVPSDMLEAALYKMGLRQGAIPRRRKFRLMEMNAYPVDEHFPRITEQSFIGGKLPDGILGMEYTVDLSNLEHTTLTE